jgi:tetratricopeptide (TPR) repeat protein
LFTRKNLIVAALSLTMLSAGVFIFYHSLDQPRRNYFLSKVPVWQYFRSYEDGVKDLLQQRQKEKATLTGIPAFDFAGSYYENANLRIIFWKKSAGLFASHPFLGVGAGNWRINVASCPTPVNPDHIYKNYTYSQPHNEWIGFLTELGLPGLILALLLLVFPVVIVFYRLLIKSTKLPIAALFYASFIAGFLLFACFDFPFKRIEHNVVFFSVLAFLIAKVPMKELNVEHKWLTWKYLRFILVAGLIFSGVDAVMRIRGEFFTFRMFLHEGKNFDQVIINSQKAKSPFYKLTPNTLPLDWFSGVAHFRLREPEKALAEFNEALKITPYEVRVINDHATALYTLNKMGKAKSELQEALRIDPCFDEGRLNLAAILFFEGKTDSARILVKGCRESKKKQDFLMELL